MSLTGGGGGWRRRKAWRPVEQRSSDSLETQAQESPRGRRLCEGSGFPSQMASAPAILSPLTPWVVSVSETVRLWPTVHKLMRT